MPLTALPKAFDLKELKKGYFPHLFNTLAHQNYLGPIPALDFYDPDHLKEDTREKLLKWHGKRQAEGYVFDFQKEIVEYCISDVEILTQACLKFRDLMKTETTVDPFQESTTIASCCNKVFRRNFLKPETIGILPNQNLYHPVLPSKMNNKLMFVNCQKCGEDFVREECQHSIQERSLKGTWVIEEVLKAIEKGYQIIETYEIWEYDTIQLSKDQEGLFSGMMNKFLQIKQQASGWPKHCLTDEEKNRYIDAFLDTEDIKLEFSKIIENPCLRSLAKLMLNSFWGKFAQKENQNKTSIVRDCGEFFDMLTNPSIHVNTVLPVNEETLLVTWEFREEVYDVSSTVNVVLASYVTALARLKLYSFLEKVEERAVYVDTDSCIYISRKGLDDISTGDFIGDMTDELNGGFISEFVSGGPKNYAYKYTTLSGEEQIVCKKEIVEYCISDVEILTQACLKFRDLMKTETTVDPFQESTTIASCCNKVFRRNFLKPETIGVIPKGGYRWRENQSKIAIQWMLWEEHQRGIKIQHAAKGIETIVKGHKVDDSTEPELISPRFKPSKMNNKLMFVNCQKCGEDFVREECQHSIQERSLKGTWVIEEVLKAIEKGYQIIETYEIWEYDTIQLSKDQEGLFSGMMNKFLQIKQQASGWPKHCLTDEEKNRYIDAFLDTEDIKLEFSKIIENPCLRSLAKLMLNSFWASLSQMSGLIKCQILPNQNLYHPVLPSKMNNKLMFVNCQKCGEDFVREECQHSIQERSLKGTWVIEEVLKAIEKGYQIIETYEIWEYDTIQLSKDQEGLFSGMMNKFLQIKQQASGWPKHCLTDEEKNRYIDAFLDTEDIKLEFSKIIENPCLRSLAKLMLNSFWVLPVNEETLLVTWEFREEVYDVSSTVNVVLASYVTALARLKLYSFLEKVEERAVYVDTDSCIYISRKGLDDISTGDFI
ncbi:unnamed protein product, partial [Acanthoscelides obtectus]